MTTVRWTESIDDETEIAVAGNGITVHVRHDLVSGGSSAWSA